MRSRTIRLLVFAVGTFAVLGTAIAQESPMRPDDWEAKATAELWGTPDPATFVRALRKALARHDATAMALLVEFPLHLNREDGIVIGIENARALEALFDEAFPPELRADVAQLGDDDWWINGSDELGLGKGVLWAKLIGRNKTKHFRLTTVNLPEPIPKPGALRRYLKGLQYTCETEKHYIAIDSAGTDKVRYRAWNKPHFPPVAPDMEVVGAWDYVGQNVCTHRAWTFTKDETTYSLEEELCGASPPEGVKAELSVSVGGKFKRAWWCY